jgi:hypothetical protein
MRRLVLLAAVTASVTAAAADAATACSTSAPAIARIADDPSDGDLGLAPEITAVDVRLDSACHVSVEPRLGDRNVTAGLFPREGIAAYFDTDGSASTGSPAWSGADVAVVTAGRLGASAGPSIGRWTGTRFSFRRARTLTEIGIGGFRATLGELGVTSPVTLGLRVGTSWMGLLGPYRDFAPDAGAPPHRVPVAPREPGGTTGQPDLAA